MLVNHFSMLTLMPKRSKERAKINKLRKSHKNLNQQSKKLNNKKFKNSKNLNKNQSQSKRNSLRNNNQNQLLLNHQPPKQHKESKLVSLFQD